MSFVLAGSRTATLRWQRMVDWAIRSEASTRSCALLRMGMVLVLWSRWAKPLAWYRVDDGVEFVASLLFYIASTAMFFGVYTRWSTAATAGVALFLFYGLGIYAGDRFWVHHHTRILVMSLCLVALTPCGRSYSLDRFVALRRARPGPGGELDRALDERGNLWGLRLIQIMVASVYLWAALDQLRWPFLNGERMQHYLSEFYYGADFPDVVGFAAFTAVLAWATLAIELGLGVGAFLPRLWRWVVIPGMLMHAAFYILLPVSTYSINMWCLYLACFDPNGVHRFLDELQGTPQT